MVREWTGEGDGTAFVEVDGWDDAATAGDVVAVDVSEAGVEAVAGAAMDSAGASVAASS
jgi:hypothetical protein